MISGLWKNIKIYCGNNHEELIELEPKEGPLSMFYACPKYYEHNRKEHEKKCGNRISLKEYEDAVEYIVELLSEAEKNDELLNLYGYKWKKRGVNFEIFEHTSTSIKIKITSEKAIGNYTKY